MPASLHARLAAELPGSALYYWTEDGGEDCRWLLFLPSKGIFQSCDEHGVPSAHGMSLDVETQDLRNRVEDEWRSFVRAAHGIWRTFRSERRCPERVDRVYW